MTRRAILILTFTLAVGGCHGAKDAPANRMSKEDATAEAIRVASTPFTIDGNDHSMDARRAAGHSDPAP